MAGIVLASASALVAAEPAKDNAPKENDQVRAAIVASLLNDQDGALAVAQERARKEQANPKLSKLAGPMASLAASTRELMPSRARFDGAVDGLPRDPQRAALREGLRRANPWEQLADARASARYEWWRHTTNAIVGTASGIARLEFFSIIQPEFELLDYLFRGRRSLSPEKRRVLARARPLADGTTQRAAEARNDVERLMPRRIQAAQLEMTTNARIVEERGWLDDAAWWHERERTLRGTDAAPSEEHARIVEAVAAESTRQGASVYIAPGDSIPADDATADALRAMIREAVRPAAGIDLANAATTFLKTRADSVWADDARVLRLAAGDSGDEPERTRTRVDFLARNASPTWRARAEQWQRAVALVPGRALDDAAEATHDSRMDWFVRGRAPLHNAASLTGEQARLRTATWIESARSLFLIDVAGRLISWPFLPPDFFPHEELLDVGADAPAWYFKQADGKPWLARIAHAARKSRREATAAEWWTRADRKADATAAHRAGARRLMREADDAGDDAAEALLLRQLIEQHPTTRDAKKATAQLADLAAPSTPLEIDAEATRRDVSAWQRLGLVSQQIANRITLRGVGEAGLSIDEATLAATIVYASGREESWTIDGATLARVRGYRSELRRGATVADQLGRSRERKRIPIAIEANMLPGFDAAPGLVPLDTPEEERRLFE